MSRVNFRYLIALLTFLVGCVLVADGATRLQGIGLITMVATAFVAEKKAR